MALQTARSNTGEAFMEHSVKCLTSNQPVRNLHKKFYLYHLMSFLDNLTEIHCKVQPERPTCRGNFNT